MGSEQQTTAPVIVRDYRPSDFDQLYNIDQAVFPEGIAYSYRELQFYIRSPRSKTLVAEQSGEVVGFVIGWTEPRRLGHIITIDVARGHQRRRIGSQLLEDIERWLWSRDSRVIYLETPANDERARAFYEHHGYWVIETIEDYYNDSIGALVMMKASRRRPQM